jgi:hypothetical protein
MEIRLGPVGIEWLAGCGGGGGGCAVGGFWPSEKLTPRDSVGGGGGESGGLGCSSARIFVVAVG